MDEEDGNLLLREVGDENTQHVIRTVIKRLGEGNIDTVVVASSFGNIALQLAKGLRAAERSARVIRAPDPPQAR